MQTTPDCNKTEGIKYIGSKKALIRHILNLIEPLKVKTVFDGFAGTTRVSQALSRNNYRVICNDIAVLSRIFGECFLLNRKPRSYYQHTIDHLNALPGKDGWFTANYGGHENNGCSVQKDGKKKPWQIHNTRKLDAIRAEIDRIATDPVERSVLLTSLILAMDEVDSTVGHHASYLRDWAPRSYKTMTMRVPKFTVSEKQHQVFQSDIFDILGQVEADLAYYDPPYGSSNEKMPPSRVRYASYYHLWKTVSLNDEPQLVGAVNRRADASDVCAASEFEEFRKADDGRYRVIRSIERLIRNTRARFILLSYNNTGRVTADELLEMVSGLGVKFSVAEVNYKRHVMSVMKWTNEWAHESAKEHKEYLILLEKR